MTKNLEYRHVVLKFTASGAHTDERTGRRVKRVAEGETVFEDELAKADLHILDGAGEYLVIYMRHDGERYNETSRVVIDVTDDDADAVDVIDADPMKRGLLFQIGVFGFLMAFDLEQTPDSIKLKQNGKQQTAARAKTVRYLVNGIEMPRDAYFDAMKCARQATVAQVAEKKIESSEISTNIIATLGDRLQDMLPMLLGMRKPASSERGAYTPTKGDLITAFDEMGTSMIGVIEVVHADKAVTAIVGNLEDFELQMTDTMMAWKPKRELPRKRLELARHVEDGKPLTYGVRY